jgi:hypothetical protein
MSDDLAFGAGFVSRDDVTPQIVRSPAEQREDIDHGLEESLEKAKQEAAEAQEGMVFGSVGGFFGFDNSASPADGDLDVVDDGQAPVEPADPGPVLAERSSAFSASVPLFQQEGSGLSASDVLAPPEEAPSQRSDRFDHIEHNQMEGSPQVPDFGPDLAGRDAAWSAGLPLFAADGADAELAEMGTGSGGTAEDIRFAIQQQMSELNRAEQMASDLAGRLGSSGGLGGGSGDDGAGSGGASTDSAGSGGWGYADVVEAPDDDGDPDWYAA